MRLKTATHLSFSGARWLQLELPEGHQESDHHECQNDEREEGSCDDHTVVALCIFWRLPPSRTTCRTNSHISMSVVAVDSQEFILWVWTSAEWLLSLRPYEFSVKMKTCCIISASNS